MNSLHMTRRQLVSGAAALAAYGMLPRFAWAADAVPATRLPYGGSWNGLVGVSGGIPTTRTKYGSTLPTTSSAAQINAAIAACPSGQYVELAAGTFNNLGNANIKIKKSGVTLRGQVDANGAPATILKFANGYFMTICAADNPSSLWSADIGFTTANITGTPARGATTMTMSGASVGQLIWIAALQNVPTIEGAEWSSLSIGSTYYPFSQCVKVTQVNGTTVTFTPAINADYLSGQLKAFFHPVVDQITLSGVENVSLTNAGTYFEDAIIEMRGADQCWVKNCKLTGVGSPSQPNAGIWQYLCYRCEIRECEITGAEAYGSSEYGMIVIHSSNLLIENNYFHHLPNVMPMMGMGGSAFAYNYFVDEPYDPTGWLSQIVFFHGSHCHYNLFEGNWLPSHYSDACADGNHTHSRNNTFARQRLLGWDSGKTGNCHPLTFRNHHDNVNVVGCVLGHTGTQTVYDKTNADGGSPFAIYNIENVTRATLFRRHNYNTVTGGIPAAEALSTGQTIPDSYLHASKPAWFGGLPWPPIDPMNYAQSDDVQNLPAGYRAVNGRAVLTAPAPASAPRIIK